MAPEHSKKRKRAAGNEEAGRTSIKLSAQPDAQIGPVLASFPVLPPTKTAFKCYARKRARGDEAEETPFVEHDVIIAGEADKVEFSSTGESKTATAGCRYYIAVHNKRTGEVTMRPAPVHVMARDVKALKRLAPREVSAADRIAQRGALQATFGTKKAQTRLRAEERNKVDVSAMEGVAATLQDTVERNTEALPTKEEAQEAADSSRLIPPYNADADAPAEVYSLHSIIPEPEFNALSVSQLSSASSHTERARMLPFSRSNWVNQHLSLVYEAPKPNKRDAKIILYISAMMAFRSAVTRNRDFDKEKLQDSLSRVPGVVLDGLLSRFAEQARGSSKYQTTTASQTSLLTHMFALCLMVDDFATDTTLIASDLSQGHDQVSAVVFSWINPLFKSLGCTVKTLNAAELKRLGLPDSAGATKRAVLELPLKFPRPRAKRRT